jgi:hypothetical protein
MIHVRKWKNIFGKKDILKQVIREKAKERKAGGKRLATKIPVQKLIGKQVFIFSRK